ncbi:YceD family protein [Chryseobacterium arthrosphaerae]|uniref:YceD family protein n=1 Tax=Chryseobacterium arthrosphaerae TaxID=651561 RepID=UPI003D35381C
MDKLRNYDVSFSGLKNGKHEFKFEIDKTFFQLFDTEQEFTNPRIEVNILLDKHTTFLEFEIKIKGWVELVCDITNEDFDYPIENEIKILVNFGEEYDDSNEDVITIPTSDHAFNIAHLIYENVMLSIPMKKISPNVSDEDLKILEQFSPKDMEETEEKEHESDPRWDALRKLRDNN